MILLWQFGLVDTLSMIQFFINAGTQYGVLVVTEAAGNFTKIGPSVFLAPIAGLGTSYKYVRGAAERRARIPTVVAFMSSSAGALTTDPAINVAAGGSITSFISYMKSINEASNIGHVLFIVPYKTGQWKIFMLIVVVARISCLIGYYYLKLLNASNKSMRNSLSKAKQFRQLKFLTAEDLNLSILLAT